MNDTPRERMPNRKIWERFLYMLFCAIAYSVAELLIGLVALFQFICVLVNGHVHERALALGRNLNTFAFQVFQFVTFNDERLPFPFSDWPDEEVGDTPWRRQDAEPVDDAEPASTAAPGADAAPAAEQTATEAAEDVTAEQPQDPSTATEQQASTPSTAADDTVRRDRGDPDGA